MTSLTDKKHERSSADGKEGPPSKSQRTEASRSMMLVKEQHARALELVQKLQACLNASSAPAELLSKSERVQRDLSAAIAELRQAHEACESGAVRFKVENIPTWSQARFVAWLQRQKITLKDVTKEPSWTHALVTVSTEAEKEDAVTRLARCSIQGARLQCIDPDSGAPAVADVALPPPPSGPRPAPGPPSEPPSVVNASAEPYDERKSSGRKGDGAPARIHRSEGLPDLRDRVSPLWKLPYSEQLKSKYATCVAAMDELTWHMARRIATGPRPQWLETAMQGTMGDSPCCPISDLIRSPVISGYRNKTEFTIGLNEAGQPQVGFLYGAFADGFSEVGDPGQVPHASAVAIALGAAMTEFLRSDSSKLPVWDKTKETSRGFWRLLTVREGRKATFMPDVSPLPSGKDLKFEALDLSAFTVAMHRVNAAALDPSQRYALTDPDAACALNEAAQAAPPSADEILVLLQIDPTFASKAEAEAELRRWAAFMIERGASPSKGAFVLPTTAAVQENSLLGNGAPPGAPIRAMPGWDNAREDLALNDTLCELRFRVFPDAFFQVNSSAAALLYKVATTWTSVSDKALVLDVCCGSGTIGMVLARSAAQVIGIDNCASSIKDAKASAAANNVTNCDFICGAAEDVLEGLLLSPKVREFVELVAVVDPPRMGLHKRALYALLACARITRLVYVSCNLESLRGDVTELCMPPRAVRRRKESRTGISGHSAAAPPERYTPFVPVRIQPLDMFPHTAHVECVMLLERGKDAK